MPKFFVIIALLLGISQAAWTEELPPEELSLPTLSVQSSDRDVDLFYSQLRTEAEAYVGMYDHDVMSKLQTGHKAVLDAILLNVRRVLNIKQFLKSYGRSVGTALLAGEVVSSMIGPAFFASIGQPALAALSLGFPGGPFAAGVVLKLKMALLGYDMDKRISSVLYQEGTQAVQRSFEIDVVKKITNRAAAESNCVIEIGDLETLIRDSGEEGKVFLRSIYQDKLSKPLYVSKMVSYLDANPSLARKFGEHLAAFASPPSESNQELRLRLRKIDDLQKETEVMQKRLKEMEALLPGRFFNELRHSKKVALQDQQEVLTNLRFRLETQKYYELFEESVRIKSGNGPPEWQRPRPAPGVYETIKREAEAVLGEAKRIGADDWRPPARRCIFPIRRILDKIL
jgi:hypothetical protein